MGKIEIGKLILNRVESELHAGVLQRAKAFAEIVSEKQQEKKVWLIPGNLKKGHIEQRNILSDIVGTAPTESPYLRAGGVVASKNSPLGNALAELDEGTGELTYEVDKRLVTINVLSKADYNISITGDDAIQGDIVCDEGVLHFENSLRNKLIELERLIQYKHEKNNLAIEESKALQMKIEQLQKEIEESTNKAKRYRRTTASIRQKFLLDQDQNKIKRTQLLNGPLVINGGPGTGKTTLLIHRIQYMLDAEIENDVNLKIKLSNDEKSFLRNQKTGWIFFSPTELLKKYLENAMAAEGLEAHDDTVKTWDQQRAYYKTAFGLFNTEKGRPFQSFNDNEYLWSLSALELKNLINSFESYFLNEAERKIKQIAEINLPDVSWKTQAQEIIRSLNLSNGQTTLAGLIIKLNDVENRFSELRISIEKQYKDLIDQISVTIQRKLTKADKEYFIQVLKDRKSKNMEFNNEEDEKEQEEFVTAFEDEEIIDGKKLEVDTNKIIKRVIRLKSLTKIDANTTLKKSDQIILDRIEGYYDDQSLNNIGTSSLFNKYFKPLLKGADSVLFSLIPRAYKSYRKELCTNLNLLPNTSKEKLKVIIATTPINTRIHNDELDFLILVLLKISRVFYQTSPQSFQNSENSILNVYKSSMKALVAVDEATDFTLSQIASMYYMSRPRLNAMTLSGDVMQQMNEQGIEDWKELKHVLPDIEIRSLTKSYRQTNRLLELAIELYKNRFGVEPGFYSAEKANEDDPAPLVFINEDFKIKVDWIAEQIISLFNIYENIIPNIAVFVKDDKSILEIADLLNKNQKLLDYNIRVKPCIGEGDIGSAEFVRVFNINLIKGMEFESVFFIDIDDYEDNNIKILDKLIYVGISRATYYLAITLKNGFPKILEPIKHLFENGSWGKRDDSDY